MLISAIEGLPLVSALFETSSAIGTVGLTLGITPSLGYISRGILIGLMFFGRVVGMTLIFFFHTTVQIHFSEIRKLPTKKEQWVRRGEEGYDEICFVGGAWTIWASCS